ncbi:MAG: hypothetical protein LUD51_01905 [Clostridia bacterium]|nr:hypothetical protein [Clostridia bacterium]
MTNLTDALNFIDDDLIADTLDTMDRPVLRSGARTVRWGSPSRGRRHGRGIVAAVCSCVAVIVCALIVMWCLLVFRGSDATDPRNEGDNVWFAAFDSVSGIYPDEEMASRLSGLELDSLNIQLCYSEETDWQDSSNWTSLLIMGNNTGSASEDGTVQHVSLYCMFTGTLDDWKANPDRANTVENIDMNGVEVQITDSCNADFEKNGIIYNLRIAYGDTETGLMSILDTLLG